MEFQAIYNMRDRLLPILKKHNIKYTELKPKRSFLYDMLEKPINSKKYKYKYGYSWCGGNARWGTTFKKEIITNYLSKYNNYIEYVGIAYDEQDRIKEKIYPLIEWEMTEKDCLEYCYKNGFYFDEYDKILNKTIMIYDYLDRASCWCCRNKNLKELRMYYHYIPMYWNKLKDLQLQLPNEPFKKQSGSVFELEERFKLEDRWIEQGRENELKSKEFFRELKTLYRNNKNNT